MADKTINWTLPMLKRFKAAQKAAVVRDDSEFFFEGNEFDVKYAKYIIQHLDSLFKAGS
jgi:hypothetical protein